MKIARNKIDTLSVAALGALYGGDDPSYFEKCLESIRVQTVYVPVYIVVDGPIGHDLEQVIEKFRELNIRYLRRAENKGLALALQYGLNYLAPHYEYLIRFDADDVNRKDRFEVLTELISQSLPDLMSSQMVEIDALGTEFSRRNVPLGEQSIKRWMPFRNPINHPACIFKIKSALNVGGYLEMPFFEDWYLWERMLADGCKVVNSSEYLVYFRATDDMVRRRHGSHYRRHEREFFIQRLKDGHSSRFLLIFSLLMRQLSKLLNFTLYRKLFFSLRR